MRWKIILLSILLGLVIVLSNFICHEAGYRAGQTTSDPAAMAGRFAEGKASFCDLDEDARLFVCPAMRRGVPLPSGAALVYICRPDGETGFVSFLGVSDEVKAQAIAKLVETGLAVKPHCTKNGEEAVAVRRGQWKTAALTR